MLWWPACVPFTNLKCFVFWTATYGVILLLELCALLLNRLEESMVGIISNLYTTRLSACDGNLPLDETLLATPIESDLKQDLQSVLLHEIEVPLVDIGL